MTPKDKLKEIILDFAIEKFSHFFRLKTQAQGNFRLNEEVLSYYNDADFSDFLKLGQIEFSETEKLVLISAKVSKNLSERSGKKAQYEKAKRILRELTAYSAGIFIFYDKDANFRFSLIYPEPVGTRRQWSNFHRFTYFVSREFTNKTFLQRIGEGDFSKLEKVKDAFSVEKVTKEFYLQYKKLFEELVEDLLKNHTFLNEAGKNNINPENFAKKLLGQVIFLYFLQKKGWLGVPAGEKWGMGDKNFISGLFQKAERAGVNFYNDYLEKLFYDALNNPRRDSADPSYYKPFDCRIPFLNGGLFESEYNWKNSLMYLDNAIFKRIFDVFDRYNFTVEEESPDDKEVAIDPEMLGKVFENLLKENLRKGKGTYYTPREIVQYMCQESLVNYLVSHHSNITEQNIRDYMFYAKSFKNFSEQKVESFTFGQYKEFDNLLRNIRVVDPACGSGAFLVGMLKEIVRLRLFLQTTPDFKLIPPKSEYQLKKETVRNCIYGVDIDSGAVEIAKLRLWLSLVVNYELEEIEPLPNLDYKIMVGNSLIDKAIVNDASVKIFDLSYLEKTEHAVKYKNLFEIEPQEELFASEKKREIKNFVGRFIDKKEQLFKESDLEKKVGLRKEINRLENEIIRISLKEELQRIRENLKNNFPEGIWLPTNQLKEKLDLEFQIEFLSKLMKDDKELDKYKHENIFLWHLNFIEIFRQKGGFDVVIANPPYVRISGIDESSDQTIRNAFTTAFAHYDLYIPFFEKGVSLLKLNGVLSFISPNKYLTKRYGIKLREFLLNCTCLLELVDTSQAKTFDTASVYPVITILSKRHYESGHKTKVTVLDDGNFKLYFENINTAGSYYVMPKEFRENDDFSFDIFVKPEVRRIFSKFKTDSNNLGDYARILTGTPAIDKFYEWGKLIESENSPILSKKKCRKFINVSNIKPYFIEWGKEIRAAKKRVSKPYLIYDENLVGKNKWAVFEKRKIVIKGTSLRLTTAYDTEGYANLSLYAVIFNENHDDLQKTLFHLALLNSNLLNFWYTKKFATSNVAGNYISFNGIYLEQIPIKNQSGKVCEEIIDITGNILKITDDENYLHDQQKQHLVTNYQERIDQLVYKFYGLTPEEIAIVEDKK